MPKPVPSDALLAILRDPLFWDSPEWISAQEIAGSLAEADAEEARAAALCERLLTGPAERWPERFSAAPEARKAAVVRELLRRSPALLERRPAHALQVTSIAVAIADVLEPPPGWPDGAITLHAQALRDHAYVLSFLGRYHEALQYVERAERAFGQILATSFDLARLALVKASVLKMLNRVQEAIALSWQAAEAFRDLGDRPRYVNARITEAAMLYSAGAVQQALDICNSLKGDPGLDALGELRITHNIAVYLCDLGRHAEAVAPLEYCVAEFSRLDMVTERTRSRWYLGNALLGVGRRVDAIDALRVAWREFAELQLTVEAALAALDLAEALLASEQPAEVPEICRDAVAQLTAADLALRAVPALALLREAAAMGAVTREHVRDAQATVRTISREDGQLLVQAGERPGSARSAYLPVGIW